MQQQKKKAALQTLTQAVTTANDEINAATTNAQVDTAVQNGETNIGNVVPETQTKTNAKMKLIKQQQIKITLLIKTKMQQQKKKMQLNNW